MKNFFSVLAVIAVCLCFNAQAHEWSVDSVNSKVTFVSIKKESIGEVHHFKTVVGNLRSDGHFELTIPLKSIDTGIAIRDERMQSLLFDVSRYPTVILSANLKKNILDNMQNGETKIMSVEGKLALHNLIQTINFNVLVAKLSDKKAIVTSMEPTIINASDFNLVEGINSLKEIAKLSSINTAVPVSFVLILNQN